MKALGKPTLFTYILIQYVQFGRCKMEPFIVGGKYVKISQFPHSVFLSIDCPAPGWICGSSVLTQNILLTAAHCLEQCKGLKVKRNIVALAGHEDLEKVTIQRPSDRFIIHESYNTDNVLNDIALVYMRQHLPLGSNIKRVIIKDHYHGDHFAEVAGWGVLDASGEHETERLKMVKQKLNSRKSCSKLGSLGPGQMCAAGLSKSHLERPAEGDSGSALVTDDYQQIGLVSFRDADFPMLVVYTNVTHYFDWVKRKSQRLYCEG